MSNLKPKINLSKLGKKDTKGNKKKGKKARIEKKSKTKNKELAINLHQGSTFAILLDSF